MLYFVTRGETGHGDTRYEPSTSKRFLGNSRSKEVHDLRNENANCQIDEIIHAGNAVTFTPDSLDQARSEGYDNGHYCIGGSTR